MAAKICVSALKNQKKKSQLKEMCEKKINRSFI